MYSPQGVVFLLVCMFSCFRVCLLPMLLLLAGCYLPQCYCNVYDYRKAIGLTQTRTHAHTHKTHRQHYIRVVYILCTLLCHHDRAEFYGFYYGASSISTGQTVVHLLYTFCVCECLCLWTNAAPRTMKSRDHCTSRMSDRDMPDSGYLTECTERMCRSVMTSSAYSFHPGIHLSTTAAELFSCDAVIRIWTDLWRIIAVSREGFR